MPVLHYTVFDGTIGHVNPYALTWLVQFERIRNHENDALELPPYNRKVGKLAHK